MAISARNAGLKLFGARIESKTDADSREVTLRKLPSRLSGIGNRRTRASYDGGGTGGFLDRR
jgi:hypothetical protein